MSGLIGKKVGMTRIFDPEGNIVPVTVVEAGPCVITQVKTKDKDGYDAIQIAFGSKKRVTKPILGHIAKANLETVKKIVEFKNVNIAEAEVGKELKVDVFNVGDKVKISGISKGKGYQGVMKRHGFGGGNKTHGQSNKFRAPGSLGQSSYPSKVFKGIKMAGRTGGKRITVRNLQIVKVDAEKNLLFIKGAVPGARNSILEIRKA
ncbi:MAG: 50S ribosomal protein L3 [Calditrichia bacterium]